MAAAALTPQPISDALQARFDAALGRVPAGKRGQAYAGVTFTGFEAGVGWRLSDRWDATAWYGRTWDGVQDGGVRVRYTW